MNDLERKYLLAVERGDIETLKQLLSNPSEYKFNKNCCDPLARNALVIAIDNEDAKIIKLLIEAKIKVGDALLYAIDENFVEAVEILLEHEFSHIKPGEPHSWEQADRENSFYGADMTPLILAAHGNNFEIIKILLDKRVSPIPDPHDPRCNCRPCCQARADDCLKHSRSRINAYRALASPCLMALSSPDPLLKAFELSAKLENLAKLEPEYKQDYLRLRGQCQTFATKLLDHTRTSKELEILLNYSDEYLAVQYGGRSRPGEVTELMHLSRDDGMGPSGSASASIHRPVTTQAASGDHPKGQLIKQETTTMTPESAASLDMSSATASTNLSYHQASSTCSTMLDHSVSSGAQILTPDYYQLAANRFLSKKESMMSLDSVTGRHESYQSSMRLARLKLAIQCKQKTFCAHPNIQELLSTMWYENLPGFRCKNVLAQTLQVICIGLMFPIYSIAYLVAPHTQLGRYIKKPFIKFICHSASYITFLLVLILASQRVEAFYCWSSLLELFSTTAPPSDSTTIEANFVKLVGGGGIGGGGGAGGGALGLTPPLPSNQFDDSDLNALAAFYKQLGNSPPGSSTARGLDSLSKIFEEVPASAKKRGNLPSPIELLILIWVFSLIWAEVKQIRALGLNYYKDDMWNLLDSVASGFYVGTIVLRIISYLQSDDASREVAREHWHAYDPLLLSEGLFAAATIFSALKLVYIFSVNPYLGPLQISLGRMTVDILRFSWIYMLVLFAFACGMNQLLWYYADLERHQCLNVTNYNLAQYYSGQREHFVSMAPLPSSTLASSNSTGGSNATTTFNNLTRNITSLINNNSSTTTTTNNNSSSLRPTTNSTVAAAPLNASTTSELPPVILENESTKVTDDRLMEAAFKASLEDDSTKPPVTIDDSCKTWRHFSNVFESSQTLFWANFGLVDLENFDLTGIRQYTRFWALLMFGCYCFINVIVVLNLLIAMMNHSYVKISKRSDIEWKFARTRLWMSYFDTGSTVPAPFNIIPSVKSIRNLICSIFTWIYLVLQAIWSNVCCFYCEKERPSESRGRGKANRREGATNRGDAPNATSKKEFDKLRRNYFLTANYRHVMRLLIRRYLISEGRMLEKKSELTEAKLARWSKLTSTFSVHHHH